MTLKEAFHYQAVLTDWIDELREMIDEPATLYTVTETHGKQSGLEIVEDALAQERNTDATPDEIIDLALIMIETKRRLGEAIHDAKKYAPIDIDSEPAINTLRRSLANTIRRSCCRKKQSTSRKETGYCFDVDGRQNSYVYTVNSEYAPRYDAARAKDVMQKLNQEADSVSISLDSVLVNTPVDFDPVWDVNDSVEDMLAALA